jgi:polar amino acid transport system substrate-binding protein
VQAASAALDVLEDEEGQKALADTFGTLQEFGDYNTAFAELEAGSVDAIAMDIGVAQYQISSRGDGFVILDEHLNAEQYGIGFKLGNTELRDAVNADLATLKSNGTFDELAEKYGLSDMTCLE